MLKRLKHKEHRVRKVGKTEVMAIAKSMKRQLFSRPGPAYFRFLVKVFQDHPKKFPEAVRLAIMGYHFEKITHQQIAVHNVAKYLKAELEAFKETLARFAKAQSQGIEEAGSAVQDLFARVQGQYDQIHRDFRDSVEEALDSFREAVNS